MTTYPDSTIGNPAPWHISGAGGIGYNYKNPSIVGGVNAGMLNRNASTATFTVAQNIHNDFNNSQNFEVIITGKNCRLEEGSNLYFKILDTISGMLINALDGDHRPKLEYMRHDKNFINYAEITLCAELHTLIKITSVETWKDDKTDIVKIGILVMIDQSYIDNYKDIEAAELIKLAIG
jgi:hypothetical protein